MKKNNNRDTNITTFIIGAGIIILIVFSAVIGINMIPNYESNSYYAKVDKKMDAKIESTSFKDGKLLITTTGNPTEFCLKTTRTEPSKNALCWKQIENNEATISAFQNKKYYIWLKDEHENISNYYTVNTSD